MAKRLSELPEAGALTGAEVAPVVQSGVTVKATLTAIKNWIVASYSALSAISTLTPAANKLPYFTGAETAGLADFTAFAATLLDDADAPTARTTLGALATSGGSMTGALNTARATVASHATTADIWGAAGNEIDFTGTATITDFPDAPQAGASRILHCAGACTFTNNANIAVQGGKDYPAAAGDIVTVHAITTSTFRIEIEKASGTPLIAAPGSLVQRVEATPYTTYSSDATGSLPIDDTIPQKTEGSAYCSVSITPKSSTNRLVLKGIAQVGGNGSNTIGVTLVDTAINDCLAAVATTFGGASYQASVPIEHEFEAGSTSARTYQLRIGAAAGVTFFVNGTTSSRLFGGKMGCRLWVEEIAV